MILQILSKKQSNLAIIIIVSTFFFLQLSTFFFSFNIHVWEYSAPLANLIFRLLGKVLLSNNYFNFFASSILIFLQLFLVYNIFNKVKNVDKSSVLATWLYLWVIHLFPSMSSFSPALISATISLFLIYKFQYHVEDRSPKYLFSISMVNGLSFLIWYPSILILPFMVIVLFQYNELQLKKSIIIATSFVIPLIYFIFYYVYQGNAIEILYKFSNFHIAKLDFPHFSIYQITILIALSILVIVGVLQSLVFSSQTAKASRLFMNSVITFSIFSLLGAFLSINNITYIGIVLCYPISIFLVYYINIFKRPLLAELAHLVLLLLIIVNFTFSL